MGEGIHDETLSPTSTIIVHVSLTLNLGILIYLYRYTVDKKFSCYIRYLATD